MPYLFLCLALLSSVSIALLLRLFETRNKDRLLIIAANYIAAGALAYLLSEKSDANSAVFIFGAIIGLFFSIAFITFSLAIKRKGIAGTVTIGRLSLAIPVIFSLLLWGEKPGPLDILSLALIFLIILTWEGRPGKISPLLLALFLLFGFIDAAMKFFKLHFPSTDDSFFLIIVFWSAMTWSWAYILVNRTAIKPSEVLYGLFLGIPNFFSSYFLLKALESIPAYVVFPFINTGIIILSSLFGCLLFKERLDRKKIMLITLGILAVFFLTT